MSRSALYKRRRKELTTFSIDSISDVGSIVAGRWGREFCEFWLSRRSAPTLLTLSVEGGWVYFLYQVSVVGSAFIGLSTALNAVSCESSELVGEERLPKRRRELTGSPSLSPSPIQRTPHALLPSSV